MTRKRERSFNGNRPWMHMTCMLVLMFLLAFTASACGASARESFRSSGTLSSGEVILGESDMIPDITAAPQNSAGDSGQASNASPANPKESAQPDAAGSDTGQAAGNEVLSSSVEASPAAMAAATTEPGAQADLPEGTAVIPIPSSAEAPDSYQAFANAGIIVRSENILSSKEKEALLKELEKELNGLFGAIDHVSTEQQAGQAE